MSATSDDTHSHSDEDLFILSLANLATDGFISPHLQHYSKAPMQAIKVAEACRLKLLSALAYLCSSGKISISSLQWAIQTNWQRSAQWYQSKVGPVERYLDQLQMNSSNPGGSPGDNTHSHWIQMWPHLFAQRQAFISDLSSAFQDVHSLLTQSTLGQLQSEVNELLRDYLKPLVLFKGSQQNLKWNSRTCSDRQTPSPLIGICSGTDDSLGSQSYHCLLECQPFAWFKVTHPSGDSPRMAQGSVSDLVDLTASSSKSLSRFDKPLNKLLASIQELPQELCEASLKADLKKIRAWSTFLSSPGSTSVPSQDHERQLSALSKQLVELNKVLVNDSQFYSSSDYPATITFDLLSPTDKKPPVAMRTHDSVRLPLFRSGTDSLSVTDIRMEISTSAEAIHQKPEYFLLSSQSPPPDMQSPSSSAYPSPDFPLLNPYEEGNGTIPKSLGVQNRDIESATSIAISTESKTPTVEASSSNVKNILLDSIKDGSLDQAIDQVTRGARSTFPSRADVIETAPTDVAADGQPSNVSMRSLPNFRCNSDKAAGGAALANISTDSGDIHAAKQFASV